MNDPEDIANQIMAAIAGLPPEEQEKAIHQVIDGILKVLTIDEIRDLRDTIVAALSEDLNAPIVETTLALIDGQLALREMGEGWK